LLLVPLGTPIIAHPFKIIIKQKVGKVVIFLVYFHFTTSLSRWFALPLEGAFTNLHLKISFCVSIMEE
uniref:hypothetical protein n=1 Tax=Anaerotignum sp. TaxID=2039241 RepID=UPI002714BD18